MIEVIDLDGILVPAESVAAAKDESEFFRGHGLYETLLAESGAIAFGDLHFARIRESARINGLPLPPDDGELSRRIEVLLHATGLARTRARINLRLDENSLLVRVAEAAPDLDRQRRDGVGVITVTCEEDDCQRARHKWLERDALLAARRRAASENAGEALIFDIRGQLLEGASSSVFCLIGGQLLTPATDDRILPGITRAIVCAIARESGVRFAEASVSRERLHDADEVFLTSAVRMLVPVVHIDGAPIGGAKPGPVGRSIAAKLQERAFGER